MVATHKYQVGLIGIICRHFENVYDPYKQQPRGFFAQIFKQQYSTNVVYSSLYKISSLAAPQSRN